MVYGDRENRAWHRFSREDQQRKAIRAARHGQKDPVRFADPQTGEGRPETVEIFRFGGYLHFARVLPADTRSDNLPVATSG